LLHFGVDTVGLERERDRLFEGSAPQMWQSLRRLMALPDDTLVYCAHEYTLKNGRFALSAEPGDAALTTRVAEVQAARAAGRPMVPHHRPRARYEPVRAVRPRGLRAAETLPTAKIVYAVHVSAWRRRSWRPC